jgi:RimJ/RimL family protein N-acetyltransferase
MCLPECNLAAVFLFDVDFGYAQNPHNRNGAIKACPGWNPTECRRGLYCCLPKNTGNGIYGKGSGTLRRGRRENFIKKTMVDMASGVVYVWDVIWADDSSSRIIGNLAYAFKSEGVFSRGFWVDSDFHGQGIMPEAVAVTTDFMFDEVGVQKIFVRNASANFKSHRVQEKTGCLYLWRFPRQDSCKGIEEEEHWELGPERWREWKVSHPEMDIPFGYRTSE